MSDKVFTIWNCELAEIVVLTTPLFAANVVSRMTLFAVSALLVCSLLHLNPTFASTKNKLLLTYWCGHHLDYYLIFLYGKCWSSLDFTGFVIDLV